jgi:hypothetical protein
MFICPKKMRSSFFFDINRAQFEIQFVLKKTRKIGMKFSEIKIFRFRANFLQFSFAKKNKHDFNQAVEELRKSKMDYMGNSTLPNRENSLW